MAHNGGQTSLLAAVPSDGFRTRLVRTVSARVLSVVERTTIGSTTMTDQPRKRRGPLTLLLTSRRCRRWAAAVLALPILYLASFGPACSISARIQPSGKVMSIVYRP